MGLFRKRGRGATALVRYVWSRNMQLHVAAPTAAGWEQMEAGAQPDGLLAAVRCLRGEPPRAFALNAYAYDLPKDKRRTVEELCQQDWSRRWLGSSFVRIDEVAATVDERPGSARACLVQVDGRDRDGNFLRVVERHVPAGSRLLVVSAAGPPELHQAHAQVIDLWMTHAALGN